MQISFVMLVCALLVKTETFHNVMVSYFYNEATPSSGNSPGALSPDHGEYDVCVSCQNTCV